MCGARCAERRFFLSLYRWELQKIWKRRSARVALALMLVWTMAAILVNAFYNNSYKVNDPDAAISPGPAEIASWPGRATLEN